MKITIPTAPSDVTIVAVTKTFPFSVVQMAYEKGFRHIGENRVEEAKEKIEEAKKNSLSDIVWHMVGHVQSRKIRDAVHLFNWIDSVDSFELLEKINHEAGRQNKNIHVLLEVNVTGEKTKYGFDLNGWEKNLDTLKYFHVSIHRSMDLDHVIVEGLMTMAPYVTNPENNRPIFQSMKRLSSSIRVQIPSFGAQLSMGTSCDFHIAIQEGATQVRLGEALFGPRQ